MRLRGRGPGPLGLAPKTKRVTLDFDATLVDVHTDDKEGAEPNYKKGCGFHPLHVYCDETAEAFAGKLRPGSAGANTAADHVELLDARGRPTTGADEEGRP